MTKDYYRDLHLHVHIKAVATTRRKRGYDFVLEEIGDPSHGMRKRGLAQRKCEQHSIHYLFDPASSPDLEPSVAACHAYSRTIRGSWQSLHAKPTQRDSSTKGPHSTWVWLLSLRLFER
jgi:hypothetical protein